MAIRYRRILVFLIVSVVLFTLCSTLYAQESTYDETKYSIKIQAQPDNPQTYEILVNDEVAIRYRSMAKGLSAYERAVIIKDRMKNFGAQLIDGSIKIGTLNSYPVVLVNDKLLITVTKEDCDSNTSTGLGLASVWANNLKKSLDNYPKMEYLEDIQEEVKEDQKIKEDEEVIKKDADISAEEYKMLELVNKERAEAGVKPLVMDKELVKVARIKSQDMIDKNYFDHTSPTYGDPFAMMKTFGIKFAYAGENLAGNQTVEKAHKALMNSPGHRSNILNPNYTHIGIGIIEGGPYSSMFTQLFISK